MPEAQESNLKYHAFISYRHADNKEQGRQWATWLHQAIETYEVPEDLVGKKNNRGEEIAAHIYPIFRDEQDLPAHSDLGKSIVNALDSTRLLIVLCSPNAVASTYVADEIHYFKQQGHSDRIIAAMIAGEPNSSWDKGKLSNGFKLEDECFPEPLQFEYDSEGEQTTKHAEPIAADFRINNNGQPEQGWTTSEAYRQHLKSTTLSTKEIKEKVDRYEKQLHLMLLKIISGILGVPLSELTQRDKEYQLELARLKAKRLRQWLGAVAMLAVIAIGAGVFAFIQQQEALKAEKIASKERDKSLISQSKLLMGLAKHESDKGNYDTAMLLGLNAMPGIYGGKRPVIENTAELRRALVKNQKLAQFEHESLISLAIFSPDGQTLLTQSLNFTVNLWSVSTHKKIHTFQFPNEVNHTAFSPDGNTIVTATDDNKAILWSSISGEKLYTFNHKNIVNYATFSPDGKTVVTTSYDNTAVIWSVDSGKKLQILHHKDKVSHAAFNSDGKSLVTASWDNTAILWSVSNGKKLHTVQHQHSILHLSFSPDGKILATTSVDKTAVLWSVYSGKKLQLLRHQNRVSHATFSSDGKSLVTASWDKTAILWNVASGKKLHTLQHQYILHHATFSPDGDSILTASSGGKATLWSVTNNEKLKTFHHKEVIRHGTFSHNGKMILTTSNDKTTSLWSLDTGKKIRTLANNSIVTHASFSPDDKSIVTSTDNNSYRAAALWSTATGKRLASFSNESSNVTINEYVGFSPDGKILAIMSGGDTVSLWSLESGKKLYTLQHSYKINNVAFSPDSLKLVTSSEDRSSVIWSMSNGEKLYTLSHPGNVVSAKFSPDGKLIATRVKKYNGSLENPDNGIRIWSADNGEMIHFFQRKLNDGYLEPSFSPDGKSILTSINDNTAILLSVFTGEEMHTLQHQDNIREAVFSSDGQSIVTVSDDKTAVIWPIYTSNFTNTIINKLPTHRTCLTPEERKKYYMTKLTDEQWVERKCHNL